MIRRPPRRANQLRDALDISKEVPTVLMNPAAAVGRWSLWRTPKPVLALVLFVYAAAALAFVPVRLDSSGLDRFLVLALVGSACSLLCRRMERAREFLEAGNVPNLVSTWTFAGAMCLDHFLAAGLVVVIYGTQWFSQKAVFTGRPHRYVFGAATIVIGVRAAQLVHGPLLVATVFVATNMLLIAAAMTASGAAAMVGKMMLDWRHQATELGTVALGFGVAVLVQHQLALALVAVPVLVGIQYICLLSSVRSPASIDAESGMLTPRAWHALAGLQLKQASEAIVFAVQLSTIGTNRAPAIPEFARQLRAALRPEDLIGRNEDGFMVLVAAPGGAMLAEVLALQIRVRLADNGIDTYIGSAVTPDGGVPVDVQGLAVAAAAELIVLASNIEV